MKAGDLLRFTLVGDGSSDRALIPILNWLIRDIAESVPLEAQWADLGLLASSAKTLGERVRTAIEYYPCDILFIHRDAERPDGFELRVEEILQACTGLENQMSELRWVCVIPVRMTEAWRLIDESAIRRAAGNPQGRKVLGLPSLRQMERVDAKDVLHKAIREASELAGRKAKKLEVSRAIHDVADYIGDFGQLDNLPSFSRLRADLANALHSLGLYRP